MAEIISESQNTQQNTLFRAITFKLNEQLYAFNILHIRDIVLGKKLYRVPNSGKELLGVTNIRGEILPVYCLKTILDLENSNSHNEATLEFSDEEYLMIIKYNSYLFAINVDYIDKNISVTSENYNEGKYMKKWDATTIFEGIIIDKEDNILLIDVLAFIETITAKNKLL